nr:integrase, catalytic region, zinc finger, CCHC-type, peptidase aspartic, catalytic [Tanacetum cinerariifolium]
MALTFADTHNMIAYLTKSDASEGFDQIINFLNASAIKYALIVNPNIYVSCIKQFWSSVSVKKVNDVTRLQALIDRKNVIITKATVREALRLDDAESIDCLPNEEIFTELSRMGGHRGTSLVLPWLQLSCAFQQSTSCNLSSHTTKYLSPALTQKVFSSMRRVGNGVSEVETPMFKGMIVAHQANDVADEVVVGVDVDDVPAAAVKPTLPSPIPTTQPPPPPQALPSTSQVKKIEKGGIIELIDVDNDVTLEEVEVDKNAEVKENTDVQGRPEESQAQIYKINLEHADKVLSMQDDKLEPAELKEVVEVVTTSKLMTEVVTAAAATIIAATTPITVATITAAHSAARRRKEIVIRDPEETATPSIITHIEPKSKDKGKGIVVQEPKPLKKKTQIEQDEAYAIELEAELNKNINWMIFKMDYYKRMSYDDIHPIFKKHFNSNVAFLEKTKEQLEEEESRALKRTSKSLEEKAAKKQKLDEKVEELRKHLQIVPNNDDDVYTEATPLTLKVHVVDYEIYTENNKPYYKIIRVDGTRQLFLSFLSLLKNFDREDLEVLWQIVKERFASSKPKNFSYDFLLTTLTYMFEKPDVKAQVWKNQKGVYGLEKVKSWKLLESCGVQIITLTTTQMTLLVERRYPLTRLQGKYAKGLRLMVEDLMLLVQVDAVIQLVVWIVDSGCSKHMTGNLQLLRNFVEKFMRTVRFGNDHFDSITGYEDYVQGNLTICHVYYVEGLGYNLFSVGQFCDGDLEVAFRSNTCYVQNLEGDDLLIGIVHQTSIARMPQQNGVVERRNRTLIEAARTMLNLSKALEFLRKPNVQYFYVFGSLCYPINDRDDLGKIKPKAAIGIFVGYSESSRGFHIYNHRTKKIMETIHVKFDELTTIASECNNLEPGMNYVNFNDSLEDSQFVPSTSDLDNLFGPMYEEYYATRSQEVSDNSAANTLDNDHTSSSS